MSDRQRGARSRREVARSIGSCRSCSTMCWSSGTRRSLRCSIAPAKPGPAEATIEGLERCSSCRHSASRSRSARSTGTCFPPEHDPRSPRLRDRPPDRPFPLAADPWPLAETARPAGSYERVDVAPEDLAASCSMAERPASWAATSPCRTRPPCWRSSTSRTRRPRHRRRQHAVVRGRTPVGAATPMRSASWPISTREAPGWDARRRTRVVIGAGGAARAVVHALLQRGFDVACRQPIASSGPSDLSQAFARRAAPHGLEATCRRCSPTPTCWSTPPRSAWRRAAARPRSRAAQPGGARLRHRLRAAREPPAARGARPWALRTSGGSACCCTRRCRASSAGSACGPRSRRRSGADRDGRAPVCLNHLAILDEAAALGDLIVKRHRLLVGFMCQPVDARAARLFRLADTHG